MIKVRATILPHSCVHVVCVQAVIESKDKGTVYETIDVEPGRQILADMDFGMADDYLYVLTEQNVSIIIGASHTQ